MSCTTNRHVNLALRRRRRESGFDKLLLTTPIVPELPPGTPWISTVWNGGTISCWGVYKWAFQGAHPVNCTGYHQWAIIIIMMIVMAPWRKPNGAPELTTLPWKLVFQAIE